MLLFIHLEGHGSILKGCNNIGLSKEGSKSVPPWSQIGWISSWVEPTIPVFELGTKPVELNQFPGRTDDVNLGIAS